MKWPKLEHAHRVCFLPMEVDDVFLAAKQFTTITLSLFKTVCMQNNDYNGGLGSNVISVSGSPAVEFIKWSGYW